MMYETPEQLLEFMNTFEYEWMDKKGIFHSNIIPEMYETYSLMSPEEVLKYKKGICVDQCEFERDWFEKHKYKHKVMCIQINRNDSKPGHIFLIYEENNKYYWFENAWYDERGIHEYATYDELINDIKKKFILQNNIIEEEIKNIQIFEQIKFPYHISYEEMEKYKENLYQKPQIETERLIIKNGELEDYVRVHEFDFNKLQNINGITELVKMDPDEVRGWFGNDIESWYKKVRENNHYNFIVYLKNTKEPIADIGFDRNDEELNSIEISCWLHPNYWGYGYMKEALIGAMDYIFKQGFDNIIYGYVESNNRSKRLCEKLGFLEYKINEEFRTNEGLVKEYTTIMSKERFNELYKREKKI